MSFEGVALAAGTHAPGTPRIESRSAAAAARNTAASASVLQHHRNERRDGVYVDPAFTRKAAAALRRDRTFSATLSGPTYAQPLYFADGPGGRELLIAATEQNEVTAFDAANGQVVWRHVLGRPVPRRELPCGNIDPLGVTGTPVIDPASRTLFLDSMTGESATPKHLLFGLSLDDGSTRKGWPIDLDAKIASNGVAFHSPVQNQRGALVILNGNLYVPYGGHFGDCGQYRGWVVGVPLDDPASPFAWTTRTAGGGIWAPGGIASDGKWLYVATGNTKGAKDWSGGNAVVRLAPDLAWSTSPGSYFVPGDWRELDKEDADLGGSGPVLLSARGPNADLVVALGKDGKVYVLNRERLGGEGHALAVQAIAAQEIIGAAVAYTTSRGTYVSFAAMARDSCSGGSQGELTTVKVSPGSPPRVSVAWCGAPGGKGSPAVTTTNGTSDAIVWRVTAETENRLWGYDGDTGSIVFGGGGGDERMRNVRRFQVPIVAKGRLFVAGDDELYAFVPGRGGGPFPPR